MKKKITGYEMTTWNNLITKFTPHYILNKMSKKEYSVGFGESNKSFCYIVEYELKSLGDIRGSSAYKFGFYYSKGDKNTGGEYKYALKFGNNEDDAFNDVRVELANLIEETNKLIVFKDIESKLSPMFKYKVMYLYNKDIMLPSFIEEDLYFFAECLGLDPQDSYEKLQHQLMDYKKNNNPQLSNHDFMCYLYETFGKSSKKINLINNQQDEKLNHEIHNIKKFKYNPNHKDVPVEKEKPKKASDGSYYYPRDPKVARQALIDSNFTCEYNPEHKSFIRRKDGNRYTEVHHLIPLSYHYKFDKSLDVEANIVSLCSHCHNRIHYGETFEVVLKKLYNDRKDRLKAAGINIDYNTLLKMYKNDNNKD